MTRRHLNRGLRKICSCPRRAWAKCEHSWYLNFKPRGGPAYRFSLDKHFNRHIDSKTEADTLAGDLRKAIRAGTFGQTAPMLDTLTVAQLLDTYKTRYVAVERPGAVQHVGYQVGLITKTPIERPDGPAQPLGDWRVADVTVDTLDRFKETRGRTSVVAANRDLALPARGVELGDPQEGSSPRRRSRWEPKPW